MKSSNNNIVWHHVRVTREMREALNKHRSVLVWFTGLPSSGKSTIAHGVEEVLFSNGCRTYVFDGDNVRHGLCSDLGFSKEDRKENLRRIAEMSRLFIDAGIIVLAAFVSPFREDREMIKNIVGRGDFIEIYCKCPVDVCELRDPKNHYKKAKMGEIKEFTGVSSPYEEPLNPELILNTADVSVETNIKNVINLLIKRNIINPF